MNVSDVYIRGGNHPYSGFVLHADEDIEALAVKLKDILTDVDTTNTLLVNFETIGLTGFSTDQLTGIVDLNLPSGHFKKWRIGEALAQVLLEENYSCLIPFSKEANTTNHNTSNTGIDIIGMTTDNNGAMLLLFAEVKTSSEEAYPPQIVHSSKALSLTNQLKDIIKNKKKRNEHMRYLAKEFGSVHPLIEQFAQAARSYIETDEYAVYGLVVRDTAPNKNDLEKTSDALIADTDCSSHSAQLISIHSNQLDNLVEKVQALA